MRKFDIWLLISTFSLISFIAGCGGGSAPVTAPSSIAGKEYRMTITSGAGFFATTGAYTLSISATQNIYTVTGDSVNFVDSSGTYTYSANGNLGVVSFVDSFLANGSFAMTFTSTTGGTFSATVVSDPASIQSGSFIQL